LLHSETKISFRFAQQDRVVEVQGFDVVTSTVNDYALHEILPVRMHVGEVSHVVL